MSGHPWNQASLPEEWTTAPAPDNMSMQPTSNEWPGQGVPVTAHDIQTLDTAAFLSAPQSTVDFGLSPVLSHESQSSYTRNSFSEPDTCYLPPGLDLSFTSEPSWHSSGPVVYHSPDVTQQPTGYGFVPHDQSAPSVACALSAPQTLYPGSQPLEFFPQGGQVLYQRRTTSYPQPAPMRPLLPRTESPTASSDGTRGPQRTLKPHMQGSQSSQRTASSVSSTSGQSQDGSQHTLASTQSSGHVMLASQQVQTLPHRSSGPMQSGALVHPNMVLYNQHGASASSVSDPTDEDFSTYIRFDQEDQTTSPGALSYVSGHGVQPAVPSYMPGDVKPVLSRTEQDLNAVYQGSSSATSLSSDNDEGRHRTHPLYSEGPQSDGLYHCPFKAKDPNCPHKATKLKCNYDKFIDSHLKPFRCKVETCAKQEFSSTACLLRHEREAHGMHGHGDRPHLCYYPGCERGIPGNGFPRRYNLFDHMKRVHDHKEDPESSTGSPVPGDGRGQQRTGGRKRKASASPPMEQVTQRQQAIPLPPQQTQVMYQHAPAYFPQSVFDHEPVRKDQQRRRVLSQWANQRELLAKQMCFVESPHDEDNLQRFCQNVEEFRRLSAEARRS